MYAVVLVLGFVLGLLVGVGGTVAFLHRKSMMPAEVETKLPVAVDLELALQTPRESPRTRRCKKRVRSALNILERMQANLTQEWELLSAAEQHDLLGCIAGCYPALLEGDGSVHIFRDGLQNCLQQIATAHPTAKRIARALRALDPKPMAAAEV